MHRTSLICREKNSFSFLERPFFDLGALELFRSRSTRLDETAPAPLLRHTELASVILRCMYRKPQQNQWQLLIAQAPAEHTRRQNQLESRLLSGAQHLRSVAPPGTRNQPGYSCICAAGWLRFVFMIWMKAKDIMLLSLTHMTLAGSCLADRGRARVDGREASAKKPN